MPILLDISSFFDVYFSYFPTSFLHVIQRSYYACALPYIYVFPLLIRPAKVTPFPLNAKRLPRWAEEREYEIVYCYADEGISGKDISHRPAMMQMLADVKAGKIDIVLVWALSRLTRSVADLYNTWSLLEKYHCGLVSLTESFDATTVWGRTMMGMLAVLAQTEREQISERVRAAAAERASQGKRTCNEVLGYDLDGKDSFKINPGEAEQVRYIYAKYLECQRLAIVAELCRLHGYTGKRGRIQTPESIRIILSRPIYAGYNSLMATSIKVCTNLLFQLRITTMCRDYSANVHNTAHCPKMKRYRRDDLCGIMISYQSHGSPANNTSSVCL